MRNPRNEKLPANQSGRGVHVGRARMEHALEKYGSRIESLETPYISTDGGQIRRGRRRVHLSPGAFLALETRCKILNDKNESRRLSDAASKRTRDSCCLSF